MPGVSRLVLVASQEYPRYSEGDVIELSDGRLLLAVGRKEDSSDFAKGSLIGMFSSNRGASWDDEPHVILGAFDDAWGLMSVSLCRSPRGIHLFFLARGPEPKSDTRVYQIVSSDEAKTWSKSVRVSTRGGCHIVNNARVIRTSKGRLIVPVAFCDDIGKHHDAQIDFCLYSDDDGVSWKQSGELAIEGQPLMEPGVAECADGSLYMTIRTKLGFLYESRSRNDGATWVNPPTATKLPSPVAPSTVTRDPTSNDLWMIWINREGGNKVTWKQRMPLSLAVSRDNGATWGEARDIESDPKHGYGYASVDVIKDHVLLTYYDWADEGQKNFVNTSLRQRTIPLAWFHGQVVPPVFRSQGKAVDAPAKAELLQNERGTLERFVASGDAIIRKASGDGQRFSSDVVFRAEDGVRLRDIRVFRCRRFYLGLVGVSLGNSAAVQPQWAWSHDGQSWALTGVACVSLGDESTFDSRAIGGGSVVMNGDEVIWTYRGSDGKSDVAVGRATLSRKELDAWLDSLPQP